MFDLFNQYPVATLTQSVSGMKNVVNDISMINGLQYIPNFITFSEISYLTKAINSERWLADIKRRVQHYGYKYDYKARSIDYSMFLGQLPIWALPLASRLYKEGFMSSEPDQLIVNEYEPGQGIANHIDCEPCFGDTVISLSLGSPCVMDFINVRTKQKVEVMLESGSLAIIAGEARYNWTHGIAQRKTDTFGGIKTNRTLRISLTFRKVILR